MRILLMALLSFAVHAENNPAPNGITLQESSTRICYRFPNPDTQIQGMIPTETACGPGEQRFCTSARISFGYAQETTKTFIVAVPITEPNGNRTFRLEQQTLPPDIRHVRNVISSVLIEDGTSFQRSRVEQDLRRKADEFKLEFSQWPCPN